MMKTIGIYLIFLTLIVSGCKKNAETDASDLEKEVKLKAGEAYTAQKENLTVTVKKITDSRCPTGVVCVWAGEATVWLDVNDGKSWEVVLKTVHQPIDTVNNYVFKLINVLPYPVYQVEVPDSEKIVVLQIDKL
jgi:hypothetical protein